MPSSSVSSIRLGSVLCDLASELFQGSAGYTLGRGERKRYWSLWGVLEVCSCPTFLSLWNVSLFCRYGGRWGVVDSEPMPVETPGGETDQLSEYLEAHSLVGSSIADDCHNSSAAAVCPFGHNSDASKARFDGGVQYLGEVLNDQNMSTIVLEVYELEEELSGDEANIFSNPDEEGYGDIVSSDLGDLNLFVDCTS